jgi:hypothetical protein
LPLSKDNKLILSFFIILIIQWIFFMFFEFSWANDTFQKVILAPLGEEPFKLFLAFVLLLCGISFSKSKNSDLPINFLYCFVLFSVLSGLFFGLGEGSIGNIFLHIAASSIGAIFIILIYLKVKDRSWKTRYKLITMYLPIFISIFLHSLGNQFMNLSYVKNHPEFEYLVPIARFLVDNKIIADAYLYDKIMFVIALILIVIWHLYLYNHWKKNKNILR